MKTILFSLFVIFSLSQTCLAQTGSAQTWLNQVSSNSTYHQLLASEAQRVIHSIEVRYRASAEMADCDWSAVAIDRVGCRFRVGSQSYIIGIALSKCGLFYVSPRSLRLTWDDPQRGRLATNPSFSSRAVSSMVRMKDLFPQTCSSNGRATMPNYCSMHPGDLACRGRI